MTLISVIILPESGRPHKGCEQRRYASGGRTPLADLKVDHQRWEVEVGSRAAA